MRIRSYVFSAAWLLILSTAAVAQTSAVGPSHGPLAWKSYGVHSGMSYFYGMTTGDFDKDGFSEVAFADSYSAFRNMRRSRDAIVYLNNNRMSSMEIYWEDFSFHSNPNPNPHQLIERMLSFDVNQDGWLDIVAVANSHDSVVAYINPGSNPTPWGRVALTMNAPGAVNLALADPDGDGDKDIIVTMRDQTTAHPAPKPGLGWLRNDGNGAWTHQDIEVNVPQGELRTVQAFDIFEDGRDCIVVANAPTGEVFVYRQRPSGIGWNKYRTQGVNSNATYNLVADVTGDGRPELVFGRGDGLYYADLRYNVLNPPIVKITGFHEITDAVVTEIVSGDLDHDGVADLVYTLRNLGIYYTQRKPAGWQTHWVTSNRNNYQGVKLMDYDGDGRLDVLANIEYERNALEVWHNMPP